MKNFQYFLLVKMVVVVSFNYGFSAPTAPVVPPVVGAPVGVVVPGGVPAASTTPAPALASPPITMTSEQALDSAIKGVTPLFSTTGASKISNFTMFFSLLNSRSPTAKTKQAITAFEDLVLKPALTMNSMTSQQLVDIQNLLKAVIAQVGVVDSAATSTLVAYEKKLTDRATKISKVDAAVVSAAAMPDTQLDLKITSYANVVRQIGSDTFDSTRQALIKGIELLCAAAKNGTTAQLDALKPIFTQISLNSSFLPEERNHLTTLLTGNPTLSVATLDQSIAGAGLNPQIVSVFSDLKKAGVSTERKCQIVRDAVPLIVAGSSIGDKNSFITFANDLFPLYFTMNSVDIAAVQGLFSVMLGNTFLLAPQQNTLLGQWVTKLTYVQKIAETDKPVLESIKNYSKLITVDLAKSLQAIQIGLNLLVKDGNVILDQKEFQTNNKDSLIVCLSNLLSMVYSKRTIKDPALIKLMPQLGQVFDSIEALAKANSQLQPLVQNAARQANIAFLNKMIACQDSPALAAIQHYKNLVVSITSDIDSTTKGYLIDAFRNLYGDRYARAAVEIVAMQQLFAACAAPDRKEMLASYQLEIAAWGKGLALWNDVLNAEQAINTLMGLLSKGLPIKLSSCLARLEQVKGALAGLPHVSMIKDRSKFVDILISFFPLRGFLTSDELGEFNNFLKGLQKNSAFFQALNTSTQALITSGIQELDVLIGFFAGGNSGTVLIDALLNQQKNINALRHALDLMIAGKITTDYRIKMLVEALNVCIANVGPSIDRSALIGLLQGVVSKGKFLLIDNQVSAINKAIVHLQQQK